MNNNMITSLLQQLNFNGMLAHLEQQADETQSPDIETLLQSELAYRQARSIEYRLKLAKLPQVKQLDTFEWHAIPCPNQTLQTVKTLKFIANQENVLLMGQSGTGKTHLALGLCYQAILQGHRARYYQFNRLARALLEAKQHHYEQRLFDHLYRFKLIVVDELGYLPLEEAPLQLMLEFLANAYESVSLVITTQLPFDQWQGYFKQAHSTQTIIDRLTHRCHIIETGDQSWRLKEKLKQSAQANN